MDLLAKDAPSLLIKFCLAWAAERAFYSHQPETQNGEGRGKMKEKQELDVVARNTYKLDSFEFWQMKA